MEQLAIAKEKWYEKEVARKNEIELKRHQLIEANADIKTTNKSLLEYNKAVVKAEQERTREPTLNDFYKPSKEMEEYQALTMVAAGLTSGLVGYGIYKWTRK